MFRTRYGIVNIIMKPGSIKKRRQAKHRLLSKFCILLLYTTRQLVKLKQGHCWCASTKCEYMQTPSKNDLGAYWRIQVKAEKVNRILSYFPDFGCTGLHQLRGQMYFASILNCTVLITFVYAKSCKRCCCFSLNPIKM